MLALIDGNNFYASCERIFQPQLRGRPLIVLSNNDGCAIARSDEAKALGVKMGQPLHQIAPAIRRQLAIRSANFTLYGDISARVLSILRDAIPRVEPYSIDESFLDLQDIPNRTVLCRELSERVQRWTGIPNCIGIGPTKTLAKLANHVAKEALRKPGSYALELGGMTDLGALAPKALSAILAATPVQQVWGVGRRYAARLEKLGISTALQLRDAPAAQIARHFGVVLSRTQQELAGVPCIDLQEVEPDRQQIMVSRSFGERVTEHHAVHEALASFALRACEKLRQRALVAAAVGMFASTNWFDKTEPQHHPQRTCPLPAPTADTRIVLQTLQRMQTGFLQRGMVYKKAGVWLMDLARPQNLQADLFNAPTIGNDRLMAAVDAINQRFGTGTIGLGASGWRTRPKWGMRQQRLSQRFTTCWGELAVVEC